MRRASLTTRRGFTLIEMLVVLGISLLLAAIAAGVGYSGMIGSQRTVSSADRVSGWLILAKQRALRDQRPSGVRFIGKSVGGNLIACTEAQYIETPEPWVPSAAARLVIVRPVNDPYNEPANAPALKIYFASTNVNDISELIQRVHENDRIVLHDLIAASYQITGDDPTEAANPVPNDPGLTGYQFALIPLGSGSLIDLSQRLAAGFSPDAGGGATPPGVRKSAVVLQVGIGFQSQPQPVLGEPLLQITDPMMIDARVGDAATSSVTSTTIGVNLAIDPSGTSYGFDVIFNPSGQLQAASNSGGVVCLWLRNKDTLRDSTNDVTANPRVGSNFDLAGEQLLVVISTRTGLISTQPVNNGANPYLFAQDGKNNGV